ncbi:MAG: 50S ribosomal protein L23 [Geobacter sp.]|nr:50S ribosomal protein L23 [Geobacter sp.]
MNIYDVIKRPLISEKTSLEGEGKNIIAFEVASDANKIEIRKAVEQLFKVQVAAVNTAVARGKVKRVGTRLGKRSNWKKAYVTLKEGSTVDFFEV